MPPTPKAFALPALVHYPTPRTTPHLPTLIHETSRRTIFLTAASSPAIEGQWLAKNSRHKGGNILAAKMAPRAQLIAAEEGLNTWLDKAGNKKNAAQSGNAAAIGTSASTPRPAPPTPSPAASRSRRSTQDDESPIIEPVLSHLLILLVGASGGWFLGRQQEVKEWRRAGFTDEYLAYLETLPAPEIAPVPADGYSMRYTSRFAKLEKKQEVAPKSWETRQPPWLALKIGGKNTDNAADEKDAGVREMKEIPENQGWTLDARGRRVKYITGGGVLIEDEPKDAGKEKDAETERKKEWGIWHAQRNNPAWGRFGDATHSLVNGDTSLLGRGSPAGAESDLVKREEMKLERQRFEPAPELAGDVEREREKETAKLAKSRAERRAAHRRTVAERKRVEEWRRAEERRNAKAAENISGRGWLWDS